MLESKCLFYGIIILFIGGFIMKRLICVLYVCIVIFSLTACSGVKENEGSGEVVSTEKVKESEGNEKVKESEGSKSAGVNLLKNLGWKTVTPINFGLGFYLPDDDNIKVEYEYDDGSYKSEDIYAAWFRLGSNFELMNVYIGDLRRSVVSEDSIDFLIADMSDNAKLYSETDSYYLYEDSSNDAGFILFLLPKNTSIYYKIGISGEAFDDFTVIDDESDTKKSYKAGDFFTDESYVAFKDTLTYLGN